jgi:hypothetical protein
MKREIRVITGALMAAIGAQSGMANADCGVIGFDDYAGLSGTFDGAKTTFAVKTSRFSNAVCPERITTFPDSRMNHRDCRIYEQSCGTAFASDSSRYSTTPLLVSTKVFVWDQSPSQHYHLMFEDPAYNGDDHCFPGTKWDSYTKKCVPPADYAKMSRYLMSMANDAWLEIGRTSTSNFQLFPFNMTSIDVKDIAVQLWVLKTDGSVIGWSNLPRGNWSLGGYANNIVTAWVAGAPGTSAVYSLWDFGATAQ